MEHRQSSLPHQWRGLDKTLIKRADKAHSRIPICSTRLFLKYVDVRFRCQPSQLEVCHWCNAKAKRVQSCRSASARLGGGGDGAGDHHHHQNKLPLLARQGNFAPLPPLSASRINIFVKGKCMHQEAAPVFFFYIFLFHPSPNLLLFLWPQPSALTYVLTVHSATLHW